MVTLGEQLMTLKARQDRKRKEQSERAKLVAKYGAPIKPSPVR